MRAPEHVARQERFQRESHLNNVQIVGTGSSFLKQGIRGAETVIEEMMLNAKKEIQLVAYVLTPQAIHVVKLLEQAADRGVRITMVVNNLEAQPPEIRRRLAELQDGHAGVRLVNFSPDRGQLHAKVVIADRSKALIGSANFTWSGLVSNYELGVLIDGELCWKIASLIDSLVIQ